MNKTWKQHKYSSASHSMRYLHTMEYYSRERGKGCIDTCGNMDESQLHFAK